MDKLDALLRPAVARRRLGGYAMLAAGLLLPVTAAAHAFPTAEQPAAGATVGIAPAEVVIDFDAPIEALFATLEVRDAGGHEEANGPPAVGAGRRRLTVHLTPLAPGRYTVKWSVVAEDGHRTEGMYTFTVGGGGP
jgi:copper resistance protein C